MLEITKDKILKDGKDILDGVTGGGADSKSVTILQKLADYKIPTSDRFWTMKIDGDKLVSEIPPSKYSYDGTITNPQSIQGRNQEIMNFTGSNFITLEDLPTNLTDFTWSWWAKISSYEQAFFSVANTDDCVKTEMGKGSPHMHVYLANTISSKYVSFNLDQ